MLIDALLNAGPGLMRDTDERLGRLGTKIDQFPELFEPKIDPAALLMNAKYRSLLTLYHARFREVASTLLQRSGVPVLAELVQVVESEWERRFVLGRAEWGARRPVEAP